VDTNERFEVRMDLVSVERAFYCEGSVFENCLVEKGENLVLMKIIKQRGGEFNVQNNSIK
jgi:hypothetical protein